MESVYGVVGEHTYTRRPVDPVRIIRTRVTAKLAQEVDLMPHLRSGGAGELLQTRMKFTTSNERQQERLTNSVREFKRTRARTARLDKSEVR